ncbi:MAG TPA: hypothetical protein VHU86_01360 [Solirubrobacterales bacterium]|jgi:hypothetical protein|nr:hypothetical protein [Solirubrobacterales bacterium]
MGESRSAGLVAGAAVAVAVLVAGCGSSGGSRSTERELLTQTRAKLREALHPKANDVGEGVFDVPTGTCTVYVIATGADAPAYEGYPWAVESPDGEVAIKVGGDDGALQEDCNVAIEEAMDW